MKSIIMGSGLGDIVMGCHGILALEKFGVSAFEKDTGFYVRTHAVDIVRILLPGKHIEAKSTTSSWPHPRYYTFSKTSLNITLKNWFTHDYFVNFSGSRSLYSYGHPKPSLSTKLIYWANELRLEGRIDLRRASVGYSGLRMWAPLAAKYDISETALLCGFADALPVARARLGAHLANLPSAGAATRLAIFPGGNSFQFLPAEFVRHLLQMLGETEYCCYFSPHDDLIPIFQAAGLKCATTNGMDELLTVLRGCQVCVTADSFVSHLAQIVCREHVALLSRDLPQHVMHPFCRSSVVYEHVECAPCVYLERPKYARCAAGRETCKVFDLKSYRGEAVRQIGKALANSNTDF